MQPDFAGAECIEERWNRGRARRGDALRFEVAAEVSQDVVVEVGHEHCCGRSLPRGR